jgi:ribonuclease BN (tRNA processing enzyme)
MAGSSVFQAGTIAARAGVKRMELFHFSPQYKGREELLRREAAEAFAGKKHLDKQGHLL